VSASALGYNGLVGVGATPWITPVLIVFFLAQQYIIRGIVLTGLAGR
jgi:ABC-type glycerol-3-phosphate transport system permease component